MPEPLLSPSRARLARLLAAATLAVVSVSLGRAEPLQPPERTCTSANCKALVLQGRINGQNSFDGVLTNVWVEQFPGVVGSCLRFDVTAESKNLAMSVVAPDGRVYSNLNKGGANCSNCPKVIVANSKRGAYTAIIAPQGAAAVDATFTLRVAAYNSGNNNCSGATAAR